VGPAGSEDIRGSLDCGADETVLPLELGQRLGVSIDMTRAAEVGVVGGTSVVGFYGDVDLVLSQGRRFYQWGVKALFIRDPTDDEGEPRIRLGLIGFFEFFAVTLDSRRRRIELHPAGRFTPRNFKPLW
jgi:hypothetical protein